MTSLKLIFKTANTVPFKFDIYKENSSGLKINGAMHFNAFQQ